MRDLPSEVLQAILRVVRVSSIQVPGFSLPTCLRVCSLWCTIGTPLLYADVILNNSSLHKFTENSTATGLAMMRSLSIKIKPERAAEAASTTSPSGWEIPIYAEGSDYIAANGSSETRALWASLIGLASTVSRTGKLESFSLLVTSIYPNFKREGFWLRGSDIGNIVASLPPTLRHLEVDTKGYDRSIFSAQHLCQKFQNCLPFLQSLRLRLATLCPSILELAASDTSSAASTLSQTSSLENVVISLVGGETDSTINLCEDTEKIAACPESSSAYRLTLDSCRRLRTSLVSRSEKCLSSQVFPSIARLSVIDSVYPIGGTGYGFSAINDRNLVKRTTTSNPFYTTNDEMALHYRDVRGENALAIGNFFEIEAFAEGNAWIETINGSRFPASFKESSRCREGQYLWRSPQVVDRQAFRAKGGGTLDWWHYEDLAGRSLLRARVTDGVGDVETVERERSKEELDDEAEGMAAAAELDGDLVREEYYEAGWSDDASDGD